MASNNQIKSKGRVTDHGEVFTNEREVNGMLNLVKNETERSDSRFLEPACGTGNFLVAILNRKLTVLKQKYVRSQLEYEKYGVIVISICMSLPCSFFHIHHESGNNHLCPMFSLTDYDIGTFFRKVNHKIYLWSKGCR